jgi:hypothetical protein
MGNHSGGDVLYAFRSFNQGRFAPLRGDLRSPLTESSQSIILSPCQNGLKKWCIEKKYILSLIVLVKFVILCYEFYLMKIERKYILFFQNFGLNEGNHLTL